MTFSITLDAAHDTMIGDGSGGNDSSVDSNYGVWNYVEVGVGGHGVWRSLLNFPLNELNGKIVNAFIRIAFRSKISDPILCTSVGQTPGCPTVHTITTQWGEGSGQRRAAIDGESSWRNSEFPTLWDSPGGDFNSNPIGQLSPPSNYTDGTVFEFPLNANELQQIIDKSTPYFGFILTDANNTGLVRYYARNWNLNGGIPSHMLPQLVLEMSEANDPPASPVASPTPADIGGQESQPSSNPPPSNSQGQTRFTCTDFEQDMVLDRLANDPELAIFRHSLEIELERITPEYLPGIAITTTASVHDIAQSSTSKSSIVSVTSTYELCYTMSVDDDKVNSIQEFSSQFVAYMTLNSPRFALEDRLQADGIPLVDGSLKVPSLLGSTASPLSTGDKSNNAAAIGVTVAGVVALLAVVMVLYVRRKSSTPRREDVWGDTAADVRQSPSTDKSVNLAPIA